MRYNVANVEVALDVAHGGGPRGAEPPRAGPKRSEGPALGGSTESLSAPLPPHAPLPTETGGSGGPPGPLAANPRRAWRGAPSGAERGSHYVL
jgi:hypothetical protein